MVNHYLWFTHFSSLPSSNGTSSHPLYSTQPQATSVLPSFTEVASFFGLCVWLAPFSLFISLSAGDNVLPTTFSSTPGATSSSTVARDGIGGIGTMINSYGVGSGVAAESFSSGGAGGPTGRGSAGQPFHSNDHVGDGGDTAPRMERRKRGRPRNKSIAKAAMDGAWGWVSDTGEVMGLWRGEGARRF